MSELDNVWKYLTKESHKYLEKFLKNAPRWLLEEFHEINMPKDIEFVTENDSANTVYILLTGIVKATDLRVFPVAYDFTRFYPVEIFGNDINAMKMFTESMARYLLDQCRKERLYLFLPGEERVLLFLSDFYEKNNMEAETVINMSRNDLAKGTALSVRTVNRTIKELIREGFLVKKGRKLILPFEKYKEIRTRLLDKVDMI